jgi:hypothetical protein
MRATPTSLKKAVSHQLSAKSNSILPLLIAER